MKSKIASQGCHRQLTVWTSDPLKEVTVKAVSGSILIPAYDIQQELAAIA